MSKEKKSLADVLQIQLTSLQRGAVQVCQAGGSSPSAVPPQLADWNESDQTGLASETWELTAEDRKASRFSQQ